MTTCISFLRGINVGGQKSLPMKDLQVLYESLGFIIVTTYIQSGNLIFKVAPDIAIQELAGKIERQIEAVYRFQVPVIIRTLDEMKMAGSSNPFIGWSGMDPDELHVTFLEQKPEPAIIKTLNGIDFLPDRFEIRNREVYIHCANGYGKTRLSNTFFEKKLHTKATTRNWNTVLKLIELGNLI
jgi:uncharacterized protein (DUF1697 family)